MSDDKQADRLRATIAEEGERARLFEAQAEKHDDDRRAALQLASRAWERYYAAVAALKRCGEAE